MQRKFFVCAGVGVLTCLTALTIAVQAQKQEAQLSFVRQVRVKPSKIMDYMEWAKEFMAQVQEHKFPYPIKVYRCNDFNFWFSVPLENIADLQVLGNTMNELMAKIAPDKGEKIQKLWSDTTEYRKDGLIVLRPDLSYIPENPRLKQEEASFFSWTLTYILPGKEQAFEEMAKKYKTLYQTKNIPDGFMLSQVIMGDELPLYVLVQSARSPADYFSIDHSQTLGEEGMAMQSKLWSLIRKIEYKQAWIARDLSYTVQEK